MSHSVLDKGQCLCGAVQISTPSKPQRVGACHCTMCRQWSGGPFLGIDCGSEVVFDGADNIGVYESSEWAERGFCRQCGSHLFYRFKQDNRYFVPIGLLETCEDVVFDHQVFIDEKPEYYSFSDKTHNLTGAEVFAMFASTS
jgi:hypothetical protein